MKLQRLRWLAAGGVMAVCLAVVVGPAMAVDVQHGISVTKGCSSAVTIVSAYSCTYSVRNNIDEAQDTLTFNSFVDTVHAAGGNVSSGEMFTNLRFEIGAFVPGFSTAPFCSGGVGTGTAA